MTVGNRIKNRRIEIGLTQEELGKRLGKTRSAVCKVEKDVEQNLTLDRVSEFAKALNCTEAYLMGWEDYSVKELTHSIEVETSKRKEKFEIMDKLNALSTEDREMVINIINSLYDKSVNK